MDITTVDPKTGRLVMTSFQNRNSERLEYDITAAEIVDAIFRTVKSTLVDGRPVKIRNFGVFEIKDRSGRTGVDPSTGTPIEIPAKKGLAFRPSDGLKREVDTTPEVDRISDKGRDVDH